MEILSAVVWQHYFPAAIQPRRQLCRRKIRRRGRPGRRGKQLRNHADFYRVWLWLQYRLFGHCIAAVRCKKISGSEDGRLHHADRKRRAVRCSDGRGTDILHGPSAFDNTPDNILSDSKLYLDIYIWGFPFVLFYNVATGIFAALGDSRTPFLFLMFSSLANIGMDILFVTALSPIFTRGVDGVAWATFLCQGVSCVLAIVVVFKRLKAIETQGKAAVFSWPILKKIAVVAIPSILQQSFISVGNIVIQGIINTFGSSVIAGYSAGVKFNNLVITSLTTLGNGISNFTAQNIGAEKLHRVPGGFKAGLKLVWLLCIPLFVLYFFLGRYLISIFLKDPTGPALDTGIMYLRIVAPFYFVISTKLVSDSILRGSEMMNKFMIATFTDLILRVVFAKILSSPALPFGATGIWLAWPVGWSTSLVLSLLFYRTGKWKHCSREELNAIQ